MEFKGLLKLAILWYLVIFILLPMLGNREKVNEDIMYSSKSNLEEKPRYEYVSETSIPTKEQIPTEEPPIISMSFDIDIDTGDMLYKKDDCVIIIKKSGDIGDRDAESGKCSDSDWENIKNRLVSQTIVVESTPVVTVDNPKLDNNKPFENPWDFIEYVQNNWKYVKDSGKVVLQPTEYFELMEGDCDDFATMVAYYLQEVYGYDTFIVIIQQPEGLHMVAFLAADEKVVKEIANNCQTELPTIGYNNVKYVAIDWEICPGWTWTDPGTEIASKEWSYYIGKTM